MKPGTTKSRAELLAIGAGVLQSRMPGWQARFLVEGLAFRARFEWPGVVTVADDNTGERLARSLPGRPTEPDHETRAADIRNRRP